MRLLGQNNRLKTAVFSVFLLFSLQAQSSTEAVWTDLKGKAHKLSDYRGKWVVVNYWATWCPPCLDEIPELVSFAEQHVQDSIVLGVNQEQVDRHYLQEFVDNYFISYPVLLGEASGRTPFGRLVGLPTTFIISPEGQVVAQQIGGTTRKKLEDVITRPAATSQKVSHEVK